jgi:hypothetical protein
VVKKYQLATIPLAKPIGVKNADGTPNTAGMITHIADLRIALETTMSGFNYQCQTSERTNSSLGMISSLNTTPPLIGRERPSISITADPTVPTSKITQIIFEDTSGLSQPNPPT